MNHTATALAQRKKVTIREVGGKIQVDPKDFKISKSNQEEVIWQADNGVDFTVEFTKGSPFYESQFNQDFSVSGQVRRSVLADNNRRYEYTVSLGDLKLDPGGWITK